MIYPNLLINHVIPNARKNNILYPFCKSHLHRFQHSHQISPVLQHFISIIYLFPFALHHLLILWFCVSRFSNSDSYLSDDLPHGELFRQGKLTTTPQSTQSLNDDNTSEISNFNSESTLFFENKACDEH